MGTLIVDELDLDLLVSQVTDAAPATPEDRPAKLEELDALLAAGVLTEEESAAVRARILAS